MVETNKLIAWPEYRQTTINQPIRALQFIERSRLWRSIFKRNKFIGQKDNTDRSTRTPQAGIEGKKGGKFGPMRKLAKRGPRKNCCTHLGDCHRSLESDFLCAINVGVGKFIAKKLTSWQDLSERQKKKFFNSVSLTLLKCQKPVYLQWTHWEVKLQQWLNPLASIGKLFSFTAGRWVTIKVAGLESRFSTFQPTQAKVKQIRHHPSFQASPKRMSLWMQRLWNPEP